MWKLYTYNENSHFDHKYGTKVISLKFSLTDILLANNSIGKSKLKVRNSVATNCNLKIEIF